MMRGRYEKLSLRKFPLIPVIFILILAVMVVILLLKGCDSIPTIIPGNEADSTAASVGKNPDSIAIPGYEMLELKAGSKEQSLCMPNPPQNCCYFQICLYLEDGTLLWKSELIEPGTNSKPMILSKTLDDTVTVYRGVTPHNAKSVKALSWSLNQETAEWFAHHFGENGTVYESQIDKKHIFL